MTQPRVQHVVDTSQVYAVEIAGQGYFHPGNGTLLNTLRPEPHFFPIEDSAGMIAALLREEHPDHQIRLWSYHLHREYSNPQLISNRNVTEDDDDPHAQTAEVVSEAGVA